MEDILSIVIVILIAVASVTKKNKKKKAKAPDSKGPVHFSGQQTKGFDEMKEFIADVGTSVLDILDEDDDFTSAAKLKARKLKAKAASKPAQPRVVVPKTASVIEEGLGEATVSTQGISLFDDRGCIGGSIAHNSHEGDSGYPYGASEGAADYEDSAAFAEDIAHELQSMNVQRLRRAIVVSEILDRPKALRRR